MVVVIRLLPTYCSRMHDQINEIYRVYYIFCIPFDDRMGKRTTPLAVKTIYFIRYAIKSFYECASDSSKGFRILASQENRNKYMFLYSTT